MSEIRKLDLQRLVVSHMVSNSWMNIPHVSYLYEPDITDFYQEYRTAADKKAIVGRKLSFNTVMLRVIVVGLKKAPELNARIFYDHKRGEGTLNICDDINICVPWILTDGRMITPVIMNAESLSLDGLSGSVAVLEESIENTNIDELLYRAALSDTLRELKKLHFGVLKRVFSTSNIKRLTGQEKKNYYNIPEESRLSEKNLISGTVTVSNIGSLYKEQRGFLGLLEIIPPQVFAIGIGALQEKPGVYIDGGGENKIGIRRILPMCLVFDHRAVDFNSLVPFIKALDCIFAHPDAILG